MKFPPQPSVWWCPVCHKWDTPGENNPDLAPEHRSYRGVDLGDCKGEMLKLYTENDIEKLFKDFKEPQLGCATTEELIDEIKARIEMDGKLDYRTIDAD